MKAIDIIILIICILIVVFSIVITIINKIKGKTTCGCDCANCAKRNVCKTNNKGKL